MFENRSFKQLIVIYAIIALVCTFALSVFHYFTWRDFFRDPIVIIIIANIEFALIFYMLFLPIKVKRDREKESENKKK